MSEFQKLRTPDGDWVGPEELHDVLAEEGYSATDRKQFLNSLLTELASETVEGVKSDGKKAELQREVRAILEDEQAKYDSVPKAKDSL